MGEALFLLGASTLGILGALHGAITLREVFASPASLAPTDDSVREAMTRTALRLNPRTNLWLAWLGFNLSHSLGVVLFGGGAVALTLFGGPDVSGSPALEAVAVAVGAAYVAMAVRFWFWVPATVATLATLLLLVGALLD